MRLSAIHFRVASFYLHKSDEEKCSTRPWRSPDSLAMNAFFGRDLGACEPRIVCLRLSSATRLCCVIHFFSGINTISKYRKRIPSRVCVVLCLSSTALSLSLSLLYSSQGRARCSQPCSQPLHQAVSIVFISVVVSFSTFRNDLIVIPPG